jgi:hypothetical protein
MMCVEMAQKTTGALVRTASAGAVRARMYEQPAGVRIEYGIDYEKADVPARSYFADYCDVVRGRTDLTFIFGRLVPGTQQLRNQIEISFSENMFLNQLWASSRDFEATVRKVVSDAILSPLSDVVLSDKVQTFRASSVFMAASQEAVMDFYYISPGDMHFFAAGKRGEIPIEPVIRVALSSALLLEFLEKCHPLVEALKKENVDALDVI